MPKGPSQNVIARHVPKSRRGEKLKKIVIVAHYDTARASLAFSPGMVRQFPVTFALMKWATFLTPVLILAMATPWTAKAEPYLWYATMVVAAYLLIPLFINVQRELMMPFVDGANDNASGVAAMLGVLHNLVSEPEASRFSTSQFEPVQRGAEAALAADVVPEGALLSYSPAGSRDTASELPEDFRWAEPSGEAARPPQKGQGFLEFGTIDFAAVGPEASKPSKPEEPVAPEPPAPLERSRWPRYAARLGCRTREPVRPKTRRASAAGFSAGWDSARRRRKRTTTSKAGSASTTSSTLARRAPTSGRGTSSVTMTTMTTSGIGWKGGWAGDDPIGDDDFSANEAARIRRRVTESVDRELSEKEVWFVATGAEEVGTVGMQAFLDDYGDELRDALIINIDNVGAGQLSWVTAEGMARRYRAAQRIIGLAKRASREREILVKPRVFKGLSTDATPALARGFKAMTLMAFDNSGLPMNWHWKTDTSDNIEPEVVERVADLVTEMIREA